DPASILRAPAARDLMPVRAVMHGEAQLRGVGSGRRALASRTTPATPASFLAYGQERNHDDVTLSWSGAPRCDIVVVAGDRPDRRPTAAGRRSSSRSSWLADRPLFRFGRSPSSLRWPTPATTRGRDGVHPLRVHGHRDR